MSVQDIAKNIGELYFIDFGLSHVSTKVEDKAVDIYVLKRAFISTHPGSESTWDRILEAYKNIMVANQTLRSKGLQIIAKFKDVEQRGRKRRPTEGTRPRACGIELRSIRISTYKRK